MAGSIKVNASLYNKTFKYVPPTPPAELIDSSNYTLNFAARKFLNIGLDSTDEFNTIVQVITPSRYVNMPVDFLRRIFALMGNILSFVLDRPVKYKKTLFLETEFILLTSMVYQGESMLVIESKTQVGCRVLLNRADLMKLQNLEWCITETVVRKTTVIRPVVLKQFEIIGKYLDREFTNVISPPKTNEEMIIFIKNVSDDKIIESAPKEDMNFISQLKINSTTQLAEHWARRWSGENSPELTYSSMSPMHDDFDSLQKRPNDDLNSIPSSSQTVIDNHSTGHDSDEYPLWYNNRIKSTGPIDKNDGPTSFNPSPSILDFTGQKKLNKRNAQRKLFE